MNKIRIIIPLLFLAVTAFSQQDFQVSQNMFNHLAINPGFAGSNEAICASGLIREQWMGFDGNPQTLIINADAPLSKINSGVGLTILRDNLGNENNVNMRLAYAYRMDVGDGKLGAGLNLGFYNKSLKGDWITPDDLNGTSAGLDPSIPQGEVSSMAFDMSLGLFYRTNDLYVGVSSTHLTEPKMKYDATQTPFVKRHFYVTAGYFYQLPQNPLIELRPSVFIKSDGATSQFDVNLSALYNKMFWGGVSYRTGDAVIAMLGVELRNGLKIGYAYDFHTNKIGTYARSSHEVLLGYCFNISVNKSRGSYKSVRFL